MDKNINIKIKGLDLKISVNYRNIDGIKCTRWYSETFAELRDLRLFLDNFIENEYLTKPKK